MNAVPTTERPTTSDQLNCHPIAGSSKFVLTSFLFFFLVIGAIVMCDLVGSILR